MLHVDCREPLLLRTAIARVLGPGNTHEMMLDSGDFLVFDKAGAGVVVERKTVSDYLNSLKGRFKSQVARMEESYPHRILLLENEAKRSEKGKVVVSGRECGWEYSSYIMSLLSLQHEHGFLVLPTHSKVETVETLRSLHNYCTRHTFSTRAFSVPSESQNTVEISQNVA